MDGASAGVSTVEFSSVATLGLSAVEAFITTPPLSTEIIEASLPRTAHTERAGMRVAGTAQPRVADLQTTDMRVLEATLERPTASPAIAEQRLTGALKETEPTLATAEASHADPLRTEALVLRTVADTLAVDMPAVDTAAVEVTVAADTAAGTNLPV
jgi:hypothetical protein